MGIRKNRKAIKLPPPFSSPLYPAYERSSVYHFWKQNFDLSLTQRWPEPRAYKLRILTLYHHTISPLSDIIIIIIIESYPNHEYKIFIESWLYCQQIDKFRMRDVENLTLKMEILIQHHWASNSTNSHNEVPYQILSIIETDLSIISHKEWQTEVTWTCEWQRPSVFTNVRLSFQLIITAIATCNFYDNTKLV